MTRDSEPTKEQIAIQFQLRDKYSQAFPSDLLDDISLDALPPEYRPKIRLRVDRTILYVAFSDNPDHLVPDETGFLPKAQLKLFSAFDGPRKTGNGIKTWIDQIRDEEKK